MVGATSTAIGPDDAPVGIVAVIEVSLQELMATATPFNTAWLVLCVAPNPAPEITTWLPAGPAVVDNPLITAAGALGVLTDTLSNVAVARAELLELFTANPIYT